MHAAAHAPLLPLPQSFAVEIQHEETLLTGQVAYIQSALLYTSSNGERRIRWAGRLGSADWGSTTMVPSYL